MLSTPSAHKSSAPSILDFPSYVSTNSVPKADSSFPNTSSLTQQNPQKANLSKQGSNNAKRTLLHISALEGKTISLKSPLDLKNGVSNALPKIYSIKSPQGALQNSSTVDSRGQETSNEISEIFRPALVSVLDIDVQARRLADISGNTENGRSKQKRDSHPSLKALVGMESKSKTVSLRNSAVTTSAESNQRKGDNGQTLAGPKLMRKIQEVLKEASGSPKRKLDNQEDSSSDVRLVFKGSIQKPQDGIVERRTEGDERKENGIQLDLTRMSVVKEEANVSGKVRVYSQNRDTVSHFNRTMVANDFVKTRKKSLFGKPFRNEDAERTRKKSVDLKHTTTQKSYNLDHKRSSDISSLSTTAFKESRTGVSKKGTPSMILDKMNCDRNYSTPSIQILENTMSFGGDTLTSNNISPIGATIKIRNFKGMNMSNSCGVFMEGEKSKRNDDRAGKEGFGEGKEEGQEGKKIFRLESLLKSAAEEQQKKIAQEDREEEVREITQKSIMKGTGNKPFEIVKRLPKETEEIHNQIDSLMKKVNQHQTTKQRKLFEFEEVETTESTGFLNELEMQSIRQEYEKKASETESVNYEKIDSLVTRLEFFAKLSKPVRMSLLKNSTHSYYPSGATIFRRGECGDQMYVILRGSVNVRAIKTTPDGQKENVIVAVLYDGEHFGEYTLVGTKKKDKKAEYKICTNMGTVDLETGKENSPMSKQAHKALTKKVHVGSLNHMAEELAFDDTMESFKQVEEEETKRTATVEVAESCDLLSIPREQFQVIFLNLIQKELDAKLKLLLCISFFQRMDPFGLIPLANNLVSRVYTMGEVIIPAGRKVEKFSILAQGRCKVAMRTLRTTDIQATLKIHEKQHMLKAQFGTSQSKLRDSRQMSKSSLPLDQELNHGNSKAFDQEAVEVKDGKLHYVEHIVYGTLARGDLIGGRALLNEQDITEEDIKQGRDLYLGPARLSVIADSPLVEVFELDSEHAASVPSFTMKLLKNGIKGLRQFDDYNIQKEKREHDGWARFKEKEMNYIIKSKTEV